MSRFNGSRVAHSFWKWLDCIGTVRAWEPTHGENGWHPHFHLLAFVRRSVDLTEARRRLFDVWANACRLAGLQPPEFEVPYTVNGKVKMFYGADVQDGEFAGKYASKWGLDHEMTKGHMKKARKGRTPFDLLRSYLYDGDKQAGGLFQVYARAFKGKRQLVWSKGLKALFEIQELSDEETAAIQDDRAFILGEIEPEDWLRILKADLRGEVLELARHGWEPVERLLSQLRITVTGDKK